MQAVFLDESMKISLLVALENYKKWNCQARGLLTFRREIRIKMPLEAGFVQYLASLNSSEAEFNSLSLVERSSIRRNFSPPAPAQGNYPVPVNLIELFAPADAAPNPLIYIDIYGDSARYRSWHPAVVTSKYFHFKILIY